MDETAYPPTHLLTYMFDETKGSVGMFRSVDLSTVKSLPLCFSGKTKTVP